MSFETNIGKNILYRFNNYKNIIEGSSKFDYSTASNVVSLAVECVVFTKMIEEKPNASTEEKELKEEIKNINKEFMQALSVEEYPNVMESQTKSLEEIKDGYVQVRAMIRPNKRYTSEELTQLISYANDSTVLGLTLSREQLENNPEFNVDDLIDEITGKNLSFEDEME